MTWGYWDFPEGGRVRGARIWRRELAYRLALMAKHMEELIARLTITFFTSA